MQNPGLCLYTQLKEFQVHEEGIFFGMSASSAIQKVDVAISDFLALQLKVSKA